MDIVLDKAFCFKYIWIIYLVDKRWRLMPLFISSNWLCGDVIYTLWGGKLTFWFHTSHKFSCDNIRKSCWKVIRPFRYEILLSLPTSILCFSMAKELFLVHIYFADYVTFIFDICQQRTCEFTIKMLINFYMFPWIKLLNLLKHDEKISIWQSNT